MKKVSSLIYQERLNGNIVYLNMSAAGRLTSVGATLAGMVQGAKVYYVKASDYSNTEKSMELHGYTICDEVQINFLENFEINLPNEVSIQVLVELYKNEKMRTSDFYAKSLQNQKNYLKY